MNEKTNDALRAEFRQQREEKREERREHRDDRGPKGPMAGAEKAAPAPAPAAVPQAGPAAPAAAAAPPAKSNDVLRAEFRQQRETAREEKREHRGDRGPKGRMAGAEEKAPAPAAAQEGQAAAKGGGGQDIVAIIRQAVQAAMGRGVTLEQVRQLIFQMVPPAVLEMDRDSPAGDQARIRVGVAEGHLVYREEEGGGGGTVVKEWSQRVSSATDFSVMLGPVMGANYPINTDTPMADLGEQTVSFGEVADGDVRWLFVEIKLKEGKSTAVVPKLGDNGYFPVDDPGASIVRWRLSKWSFAVDEEDVITPTKLLPVAWEGGCIHLTGVGGPPY